MNVDHGRLLRNIITWATDEQPPVRVTGPGVLDVTVWRQKRSMTVHLVNLTNPMMMKGPYRELLALTGQEVQVQIPAGSSVTRVHCLVAGQTLDHEVKEGRAVFAVPSILDHEVVALDLSV